MKKFVQPGSKEMEALVNDLQDAINKNADKLSLHQTILCIRTAYVGMFAFSKKPRQEISREIMFLMELEESPFFDEYMKQLLDYNIEENKEDDADKSG